MCGIAGIIGWSGSPGELDGSIRAMWTALHHRGPDDEGLWIAPDHQAALCHRRLAILDPTPAGHQPMERAGRRLVFNGEIYNFRELRSACIESDFHSQSDTEVLVHVLEKHGPAGISRLEGMFAFAVHNASDGSVLLARDPFGIKPLYFAEVRGALLFASEVRAILATGLVPRRLDPQGLDGYLRTGSVPEPHTLVEGIRSLPPGCFARWKQGSPLDLTPFWQIAFSTKPMTGPDAVSLTREALRRTVERHFVSDVPVGIFLSGGLDSTALLGLATQSGHKNIETFSIGFDDPRTDESSLAAAVAQHFGAKHHTLRLDSRLAHTWFPDYLAAQDQPSVDGFNTYCVSRFAREHGAKVVLSGLGSDEIFGGYPSFQQVPRLARFARRIASGSPPLKMGGYCLEHFSYSARIRRVGEWLASPPGFASSYHLVRSTFSGREALQIARWLKVKPPSASSHISPTLPADPGDATSQLELTLYLRNQLLHDSDTMSMAHGLEMRVPFVDREFFDAVSQIPAGLRLASGKSLLVQAAGCLPDFILDRPKHGFSFPLERWFGLDFFPADAPPFPLPRVPWSRRWVLHSLLSWLQRHEILPPENHAPSPIC